MTNLELTRRQILLGSTASISLVSGCNGSASDDCPSPNDGPSQKVWSHVDADSGNTRAIPTTLATEDQGNVAWIYESNGVLSPQAVRTSNVVYIVESRGRSDTLTAIQDGRAETRFDPPGDDGPDEPFSISSAVVTGNRILVVSVEATNETPRTAFVHGVDPKDLTQVWKIDATGLRDLRVNPSGRVFLLDSTNEHLRLRMLHLEEGTVCWSSKPAKSGLFDPGPNYGARSKIAEPIATDGMYALPVVFDDGTTTLFQIRPDNGNITGRLRLDARVAIGFAYNHDLFAVSHTPVDATGGTDPTLFRLNLDSDTVEWSVLLEEVPDNFAVGDDVLAYYAGSNESTLVLRDVDGGSVQATIEGRVPTTPTIVGSYAVSIDADDYGLELTTADGKVTQRTPLPTADIDELIATKDAVSIVDTTTQKTDGESIYTVEI